MNWTKNYSIVRDDGIYYASGDYLIDQVYAPTRRGFDWYVSGPGFDGGTYELLRDAKAAAEHHHAKQGEGQEAATTPKA